MSIKQLTEQVLDQCIVVQKRKTWHMITLQDQVQKINWADGWTRADFELQFQSLTDARNDAITRGTFDQNGQIATDCCDPEWLHEYKVIETAISQFHEVWNEKLPLHYKNEMVRLNKRPSNNV